MSLAKKKKKKKKNTKNINLFAVYFNLFYSTLLLQMFLLLFTGTIIFQI